MKTIEAWEVRWSSDDRGSTYKSIYVANLDLATEAAGKPWGFCGGTGDTRLVTLEVAETPEEVIRVAAKTHFS